MGFPRNQTHQPIQPSRSERQVVSTGRRQGTGRETAVKRRLCVHCHMHIHAATGRRQLEVCFLQAGRWFLGKDNVLVRFHCLSFTYYENARTSRTHTTLSSIDRDIAIFVALTLASLTGKPSDCLLDYTMLRENSRSTLS